jgi:4-amino-4-deoxy-L-arabinose transferase-like glycosyltransferase
MAVALAAAIYFQSLDSLPFYIGGDEANLGIHAHAIATTGRDLNGRFLPLFINVEDPLPEFQGNRWWQPFLVYVDAALLTVLPFSEWSVRLPLVIFALVNIVLIYAAARRLFPGVFYPSVAALLLVLTPTHLIFARQAADYFLPLTFVLVWLWCLTTFLETGRTRWAYATGLALGIGFYTHVSAWVIMPMYFVVTLAAIMRSRWRSLVVFAAITVAFVLPLTLFIPWLTQEPQMVNELVGSYRFVERDLTLLQSIRDKFNYENIQDKVALYWNYFNPSLLFLTGGVHMAQATRQVGVFLLPVAVFLVVGLYILIAALPRSSTSLLLLAGLLLAPVPATLRGESGAIARVLIMLPFVILIAVHGLAFMLGAHTRAARWAAVALLAVMPFQYAFFARDYFGDYQLRSVGWYDSMNFRDVANHLIARDNVQRVPAFYLSSNLDDAGARWLFYLIKSHRQDLWPRTSGFDPAHSDVSRLPPGSLVVVYANEPKLPLLTQGRCAVDATIVHLGGSPSSLVLRC